METLGEWSWPGRAASEVMPPSWVPSVPPALTPVLAGAGAGAGDAHVLRRRRRAALLALCLLFGLAAAGAGALASGDSEDLQRLLGVSPAAPVLPPVVSAAATLPVLRPYSPADEAGSAIDAASYSSPALAGAEGRFYVYLPPGYAADGARYPVLYLLHGTDQSATAFLQVGLQSTLDGLIAAREVPPMIVVMIQGGPGPNNWRDHGARRWESYVMEVQGIVDRTLSTLAQRSARAVAGVSMGGHGAIAVALDHPYVFSVAESWMGFFTGFDEAVARDRAVFGRLGFHAFLYGAESDHVTDPWANQPFAEQLRRAGAGAESAVYPGEHSLETVEAHLGEMLTWAGRLLAPTEGRVRR